MPCSCPTCECAVLWKKKKKNPKPLVSSGPTCLIPSSYQSEKGQGGPSDRHKTKAGLLHESSDSCRAQACPHPPGHVTHLRSRLCSDLPSLLTRPASCVATRWRPCEQRTVGGKSLSLPCTTFWILILLTYRMADSQVPLYSSPFNVFTC